MKESSRNLPSRKRIFCNTCKNETNHILQAEHDRQFYEEEHGQLAFWEEVVYRFWICAGCDKATLEECYTMDGMRDINDKQIYESEFFPKRNEHDVAGKHFKQLPEKLDKIYRETVQAFNSNLDVLCAAGLRVLIEGICADKQIKGATLERKIDGLIDILPQNIVQSLHSFRFIGNTAVHELTPPQRDDLLLAIEVSEDLLNFLYELDYKARRLPKSQQHRSLSESNLPVQKTAKSDANQQIARNS